MAQLSEGIACETVHRSGGFRQRACLWDINFMAANALSAEATENQCECFAS